MGLLRPLFFIVMNFQCFHILSSFWINVDLMNGKPEKAHKRKKRKEGNERGRRREHLADLILPRKSPHRGLGGTFLPRILWPSRAPAAPPLSQPAALKPPGGAARRPAGRGRSCFKSRRPEGWRLSPGA